MSKHTKGPWRRHGELIIGANDKDVATLVTFNKKVKLSNGETAIQTHNHDDAKLIAAAPEMLEACRAAFDVIAEAGIQDKYLDVANMLSEVISKAEGKE